MAYCVYLRKSRADVEAEAHGAGETLTRHEHALLEVAKRQNLTIGAIYREVVSGETISARPVMQRLLSEVEGGCWDGVLVMEITRLARGETIDQGIVAQAFKYSNTVIITPGKTYDPGNEFDEEYFEFGLFMSRREYKMIKQRMQRGRVASVKEGKYVGNIPPFGYRRIKLQDQKGWSLEPDENADTVRLIFDLFASGKGCTSIAHELNAKHYPTRSGKPWIDVVVREILNNPVYAGWIRWGERAAIKSSAGGKIITRRPRAPKDQVALYKGLHPAIISQEQFDAAQKMFEANRAPKGQHKFGVSNPLSGLIVCEHCGKKMTKRPHPKGPAMLICPTKGCPTVGNDLAEVEELLLQTIQDWQKQHVATIDAKIAPPALDEPKRHLKQLENKLAKLDVQQQRLYDLLEQEVYSVEVFVARSQKLEADRKEIAGQIDQLTDEIRTAEESWATKQKTIERLQGLLDGYKSARTAEEKNILLRAAITHAVYHKSTNMRFAAARGTENDMTLTVYPRLPR